MIQQNEYSMAESELASFEQRVEQLLDTCRSLRRENISLKERQDILVSERAELIEKTELARSRVEAMISRLKTMEII